MSDEDEPFAERRQLSVLYNQKGMTQAEIAEKFGVSQATVSRVMKEHGIQPSRAGRPRTDGPAIEPGNMYHKALTVLADVDRGVTPALVRDHTDLVGKTANVALTRLHAADLVEREAVDLDGGGRGYEYAITDAGREALEAADA